MRLAVIADIHGNLEAMNQVLADIDDQGVDRIVCLGDNIGYGPEPEAVIHKIRERGIPSLMGNHELVVKEPGYLDWFNPLARKTHLLTEDSLSQSSLDYCRSLEMNMIIEGCLCVHGCPPDSALTYIFEPSDRAMIRIFRGMDQKICFVGHTHRLEIISFNGGKVERSPVTGGQTPLHPADQYIINVGSVGQPRDGNNKAKYVIWDDAERLLTVRLVPYDIAVTADKIIKLGWPETNALRLW